MDSLITANAVKVLDISGQILTGKSTPSKRGHTWSTTAKKKTVENLWEAQNTRKELHVWWNTCCFIVPGTTRLCPVGHSPKVIAYSNTQLATNLVETLRPRGAFWRFTDFHRGKWSFSSPMPSMQCSAAVRATYRKQQTPQLWMKGRGRGVDSFVLCSYPIWVRCLNKFVVDCRFEQTDSRSGEIFLNHRIEVNHGFDMSDLFLTISFAKNHPTSRVSFCLLESGEKEALPESRQAFKDAAARTSGLVNLVLSRQTGFFECTRFVYC